MKIIKNLSTNLFVIAFHLICVGLSGQISLEEPWEVPINERQPPLKVKQGMGIELYPFSSKLYGEIGEAYLMQGDKEKARSSYQRASEIDPENFEAKYLLKEFDGLYDEIHPKKE